MSRFDYVAYDGNAMFIQNEIKQKMISLENSIALLQDGRAKSLALTKIEEAYMWCGKSIRDEQIARNGSAELKESRDNQ